MRSRDWLERIHLWAEIVATHAAIYGPFNIKHSLRRDAAARKPLLDGLLRDMATAMTAVRDSPGERNLTASDLDGLRQSLNWGHPRTIQYLLVLRKICLQCQ